MSLPAFTSSGDLPPGVHRATLSEVLAQFGIGAPRRQVMALRLEGLYQLAMTTGQVVRFVVFGSFVTAKTEPNDVDLFMLMQDTFDLGQVAGQARFLFDHTMAQSYFGASVFWMRRLAALGGEEQAIEDWQTKRDGSQRGIVEIVPETP
jgi:hypothetical protein